MVVTVEAGKGNRGLMLDLLSTASLMAGFVGGCTYVSWSGSPTGLGRERAEPIARARPGRFSASASASEC